MLKFTIQARLPNGLGRAGIIETPHGIIETPAFIPVGTKATVKALTPEQVRDETGAQAVLANTYHLYLQPGEKVLAQAGGLGKFMNWPGPTFTDSGGFQAFSLGAAFDGSSGRSGISKIAKPSLTEGADGARAASEDETDASVHARLARVDDDGVSFKSVLDGSDHRFTPESSIRIQHDIGADIIFDFDECASPDADREYQKKAMERTHAWAERCLAEHERLGRRGSAGTEQALFGIVQGGRHEDLRRESARAIGSMATAGGFDGFGIGGSFDKDDVATAAGWVCSELPEGKPRHLLGIGEPVDLILGIEQGIDTFDCVAPTRLARNGAAYVRLSAEAPSGRINLLNARFASDMGPIDPECGCHTCATYTRAYLSHLFKAREMLAATLVSVHNLYFLISLVKEARHAIIQGTFAEFKNQRMGGNARA